MLTLRYLITYPAVLPLKALSFTLHPVCLLDSGPASFPLSGHLESHHPSPTFLKGLRALFSLAFSLVLVRSITFPSGLGRGARVGAKARVTSTGGGVSKMKTCDTSALASSFNP